MEGVPVHPGKRIRVEADRRFRSVGGCGFDLAGCLGLYSLVVSFITLCEDNRFPECPPDRPRRGGGCIEGRVQPTRTSEIDH
jgi:hypothetical protein